MCIRDRWFRKQERPENIERGRDLVKREIARLGLMMTELEVAHLFKFDTEEDFYAAVGYGDVNIGAIGTKLAQHQERPVPTSHPTTTPESTGKGIRVLGV